MVTKQNIIATLVLLLTHFYIWLNVFLRNLRIKVLIMINS